VHGLDGRVGGLEAVVADKAEAARGARLRVAHDLGRLDDHAERGESVVQQLRARRRALPPKLTTGSKRSMESARLRPGPRLRVCGSSRARPRGRASPQRARPPRRPGAAAAGRAQSTRAGTLGQAPPAAGERGLRPRAFSSTSESRLPINRLAPMSCCFLSWLALFTRMGLPYTLIMFRILIACAPARTASRAGRQPVSPRGGRRAHGPRAAAGRAGGNGFAHSPRRPHCETPQSRSPGACWSRGPWAGTR
jgi:hypothetical protein